MGVSNSPDISQQKTNDSYHVFEFIRAYIDEILVSTEGDWTNHVNILELTLINWSKRDLNKILKSILLEKPKYNI